MEACTPCRRHRSRRTGCSAGDRAGNRARASRCRRILSSSCCSARRCSRLANPRPPRWRSGSADRAAAGRYSLAGRPLCWWRRHSEPACPRLCVQLAVRKLAEHRIGALVVEDLWMKPVGIFSERDFINAVARDGAVVLGFQVQQLMSTPFFSCRPSSKGDEPGRKNGQNRVEIEYSGSRFG